MKVVIINCFETYEDRVQVVANFFKSKEDSVKVIQSDFTHISKEYRNKNVENYLFIKTKPYYKNLSLRRLISHHEFSKDAVSIAMKEKPDLLYVILPPNSLSKFAKKYKRKNATTKLVFDIMDLWPETMPIGNIKNQLPFTLWRKLRDKNLKYADFVITECDLYQSVLTKVLDKIKVQTVHLVNEEIKVVSEPRLRDDEVHLAYLGSINNIIDIPQIKLIIKAINSFKPVTLHIIGDGENKQELINSVKSVGAKVIYHGKIYDSQKKQFIFDQCHFGLNIMKNSVCVGLTMKSIDYFQHGVPIINNIPADTTKIVDKYKVGINIIDGLDDLEKFFDNNFDLEHFYKMKHRTLKLFNKKFSVQAFNETFELIYKELDML